MLYSFTKSLNYKTSFFLIALNCYTTNNNAQLFISQETTFFIERETIVSHKDELNSLLENRVKRDSYILIPSNATVYISNGTIVSNIDLLVYDSNPKGSNSSHKEQEYYKKNSKVSPNNLSTKATQQKNKRKNNTLYSQAPLPNDQSIGSLYSSAKAILPSGKNFQTKKITFSDSCFFYNTNRNIHLYVIKNSFLTSCENSIETSILLDYAIYSRPPPILHILIQNS